MIAPACPRAHSSVCSTSARVALVSSVAWWRACSSKRAARDSASEISCAACCSASCVVFRASLLAAFSISARWRSLSWRYLLDITLALQRLTLAPRDLFFGASNLRGRSGLRVALDRVGHLGRGPDHVHRVHPHGVPGRLGAALAGRLEHAELNLQLGGVAAEGLERLAHLLAVEAVGGARQVLDPRQRRQRRRLRRLLGTFGCHVLPRLLTRPRTRSSMTAATGLPSLVFRQHLNSELGQQLLRDRRRRARHRIDAGLVLREGDACRG